MATYKPVDVDQLDAAMAATANSIRAKSGGADPIVWDLDNGFQDAVEGISTGSDLPNAEETLFGTTKPETENSFTVNNLSNSYDSGQTIGYTFTPVETFDVIGFSYWLRSTGGSAKVRVWDAEAQTAILEKSVDSGIYATWTEVLLDAPITLTAGKSYTVSLFASFNGGLTKTGLTFNSKLGSVQGCFCNTDGSPSSNYPYVGAVNLMITLPDDGAAVSEYKIQVETLNGIADEVKRIAGISDQLTATQIRVALQGVPTINTE